MSNIAAVLRQEITRLARREARALTKPLHKATASFRKVIAELKRESARARADVAQLIRRMPVAVIPRTVENEPTKVRYSAASVKAQRKRLGLSAADFGALTGGVTAHTVYKWEHGAARPRSAQLAALGAVRRIGKVEANARLEQLRAPAPKSRMKRGQK